MTFPTDRQRQVLRAVFSAACRGPSPTVRELATKLGIRSTNGMQDHLVRLRELGLVTWTPGRCRTLEVTDAGLRYL